MAELRPLHLPAFCLLERPAVGVQCRALGPLSVGVALEAEEAGRKPARLERARVRWQIYPGHRRGDRDRVRFLAVTSGNAPGLGVSVFQSIE